MSEAGGEAGQNLTGDWNEELSDWILTDPEIVRGRLESRTHARLIRRAFLARPDFFDDFHYTLLKAASSTSYDIYLTRFTLWAAILGLASSVLTMGVQLVRQAPGVPLTDPFTMLAVVRAPLLSVVLPGALAGLLVASSTLWVGFTYPALAAWSRQREIDALLPYGNILFVSLAEGGLRLNQAVKTLAEARGPFGELAYEYGRAWRDVELLGRDTQTALGELRYKTPSERLADFIEELQAVRDTGTSFRSFMVAQADRSIDRAHRDQEGLLELLTAFAQVYIVVAFVAPLFTLVLLVLLSLVGGDTLPLVYLLVYGYSPVVTVIAILAIHYLDVLSGVSMTLPVGGFQRGRLDRPTAPGGKTITSYRRRRRIRDVVDALTHPLRTLIDRPMAILLVTGPVTLLLTSLAFGMGLLPTNMGEYAADPTRATALLAGLFLLTSVPLSVFVYLQRRRRLRIRRRFPELLRRLAEVNGVGATFLESFRLVVPRFQGPIREEYDRFVREARLTADVELALVRLAERLRIPEVRIATVVMIESYRSTEDVGDVLSRLAASFQQRYDIETDRARSMRLYTFVLLLGVTTFLAVVFFLDAFFFSELSAAMEVPRSGGDVPFQPGTVDTQIYRTVLFHSALIQGLGSGLLLGKLQTNRLVTGLKYSNGLIALSIVVFVFLL